MPWGQKYNANLVFDDRALNGEGFAFPGRFNGLVSPEAKFQARRCTAGRHGHAGLKVPARFNGFP